MKWILLILCIPIAASAQSDSINPQTIQLPATIILQNTDVYYFPMSPDTTTTRDSLCNEAFKLTNPNNIDPPYSIYWPYTHGGYLKDVHPCPSCPPLGETMPWQRYFTARRKPDGSTSDIIAGSSVTADTLRTNGHHGPVLIRRNEDVDFRASGTIKLESGFHVMPGAFFHAYIEPRWSDSTLTFSDEFTSTTLDHSKWQVANAHNSDYGFGNLCSSDTNVFLVADADAHDGKALDILLRLTPDSCECSNYSYHRTDSCSGGHSIDAPSNYLFSSAILRTCPWPYSSREGILGPPVSPNAPYGKYEIREKVPHLPHHLNNWDYAQIEIDMCEAWGGNLDYLHPELGMGSRYGPFKGIFGTRSLTDTTRVFRSGGHEWCASNYPSRLVIDRVSYDIEFVTTPADTFLTPSSETEAFGGFPAALSHSTDSITFYYERRPDNTADMLTWSVTQDAAGEWRIFSAPYHVVHGDTLRFSRDYQPISVTLTTGFKTSKTIPCHWEHTLNSPIDEGLLVLDPVPNDTDSVFTLTSTDPHTNTEGYAYRVNEGAYPQPPFAFNGKDSVSGYEYHTFGIEWLPNELRFMFDSNVVARIPDRLVPRGDKYYNWASTIPRALLPMHPAETDVDDPAATAAFLNAHPMAPGCWDVTIGGKTYHAGHERVDYFKVWDLPGQFKVPPYPYQ